MVPARQSVSAQQSQVDQPSDLTPFTELSTPPSRNPLTGNKAVFGLPAVFLGLVLSFIFGGNAALGCVCDEQILGKDYCDKFLADCGRYVDRLKEEHEQVNYYGWDVCNDSSETVYAAYASAYEGYGYTRKGWYAINPESCRRVITESMTDKNYYTRIERSNGNSLTEEEKSFCMWPPQPDGRILEASYDRCRKAWNVKSNKSFNRMPKGNGFITRIP